MLNAILTVHAVSLQRPFSRLRVDALCSLSGNLVSALNIFFFEHGDTHSGRSFGLFEQDVSLLQGIQELTDREDDAHKVCRLQQIAGRADGLRARLEVDAVSSPIFCTRVRCFTFVAGNNRVT